MSDDPASTDAFKWEQRMAQVQRLRTPFEELGDMANAERSVAALTICNLMIEVEELKRAIRNNDRDIADLIQQRLELISNADKLRAERDEARRDLCYADEGWPFPDDVAREKANELGCDCFKDKT